MSLIEVLKELKIRINRLEDIGEPRDCIIEDILPTMKEALLALEQKENNERKAREEELLKIKDEIVRWLPREGNSELDLIYDFVNERLKELEGVKNE